MPVSTGGHGLDRGTTGPAGGVRSRMGKSCIRPQRMVTNCHDASMTSDAAEYDQPLHVAEHDQLLRTTFASRNFTGDPVSDDDVAGILDVARFAPSGGNRQGWRVIVVREEQTKRQLIDAATPIVRAYAAQRSAGENPFNTVQPSSIDLDAAMADESIDVSWFASVAAAPVVLVVGVDLRLVASIDRGLDRIGLVSGASIYPFVHNISLAARARGLSTTLTTFIAGVEPAVQELLGFPPEIAVAAMVPLGHPQKVITRLRRDPVEDFTRLGRWDGPPLTSG